MTAKTYPIDVALTVASGKFLCGDFSALHEMVTDLAGWPVMTHHMGNRELMDAVAEKVIRQVSWMPGAIENMPDWSKEPEQHRKLLITEWIATIGDVYGRTVEIHPGAPIPPLGLFDGLERLGTAR